MVSDCAIVLACEYAHVHGAVCLTFQESINGLSLVTCDVHENIIVWRSRRDEGPIDISTRELSINIVGTRDGGRRTTRRQGRERP